MERLGAAFQSAITVLVGSIFRRATNAGEDGQTDGSLQNQDPLNTEMSCTIRSHQLKRSTTSSSEWGTDDSSSGANHSSKKRSCQITNSLSLPEPEDDKEDKGSERLTKLLLIPTIMTKIVKWLPPKDLTQLRSTCKLWNSIATAELKANRPLQISIIGECAGIVKRLGTLATVMGRNEEHPFAKLYLLASRGSGEEQRLFTHAPILNLFCIWGQQLTHLQITQLDSYSTNSNNLHTTGLRHILFNCTPALVELKLTWIKVVEPDTEDTYKELPHLQKLVLILGLDFIPLERDLIRAATDLRSLHCCSSNTERLLQHMSENPQLCRSLKELALDLYHEGPLTQLIALSRNNSWQLTKVELGVPLSLQPHGQRDSLTTEFLSLHSDHLIELNLKANAYAHQTGEIMHLRVPQMFALEKLLLDTTNPANVKFDGCPALTTLTLSHVPFNLNAWTTCLAPFSLSPVRELIMACEWKAIESIDMVDILATQFPHLNRLTVCVRRECLARVWSAWPMLEALKITVAIDEDPTDGWESARFMDHDLIGIQPADCALLRESMTATATARIDYEEAMSMKSAPGISDMKNLRELVLGWKRVAGETQISDVSGYYAFAESKLQRITIKKGDKFSDDCLAAIRQRLGPGSRIEFLQ